MGQKVNPHGLRVGVIKDWDSKWYAEGDFADCLVEDYNIRKFLKKRLFDAGISKIEIERTSDRVKIMIIFRGREMAHKELGQEMVDKITKLISDATDIVVEGKPQFAGRNLSISIRKK